MGVAKGLVKPCVVRVLRTQGQTPQVLVTADVLPTCQTPSPLDGPGGLRVGGPPPVRGRLSRTRPLTLILHPPQTYAL